MELSWRKCDRSSNIQLTKSSPKGGNAKKEGGRAKKAENEASKKSQQAELAEAKESQKWSQGSKGKGKKEDDAEKKAQQAAKKAEKDRMLAEEEASMPSKPKAGANKGGNKKAPPKPAGPGALSAGGINASVDQPESFGASGLDDAMDMMSIVGQKSDKATMGAKAGQIEKHPERRFKGAFEAYKEAEMPIVRSENPGLRLQQYNDMLYKKFQKSPDNPFNQQTVAYNATKDDKMAALDESRKLTENRYKQ
ncbi:hypothetical protein E3P77_00106 [Wallemia ichthyophaga]|uniref:DUF1014-domain-containing protein n=1 Tax=Wallemia ichthyophaga TaxID=245174 RepID=A0A4T0GTB5_WALIC|nr:hypothetical protein E3P91_00105 [Wallemia ichthyophaga]TIB04872.1 hypothetical protein E3P95_00105 [Wallemia ichthyophaga]TIB06022.1 hypothetical protein E3P94_00105 [Wallemia ichthyophaga]TIB17327.1 hypothetical protein E3P90_00106 [Wallemia ichthyophaga]TIB18544.1 hypothetical protein E3P93_00106 [Wallemia ichthyophaga]